MRGNYEALRNMSDGESREKRGSRGRQDGRGGWRPMLPRALTCTADTWPGAGLGLMRRNLVELLKVLADVVSVISGSRP